MFTDSWSIASTYGGHRLAAPRRRATMCHDATVDPTGDIDRNAEDAASTDTRRLDDELSVELVGRLAAITEGDRAAFAQFYDRTSARVHGLAFRILRNPGFAEEVTQEVYLQVWTSAARQYDPALGSPIGWLMTLTHRRSVDRVRAEQSAVNRERGYGSAHFGRDHDVVAEQVAQRLDEQQVADCLAILTDTQREAIGLAYYGGRTYREVAEQLDVALPTVKSRIRDGLIRLKNCLGVSTDD